MEASGAALGHRFADPALLREALTHRSAARAGRRGERSNERLEFIGDRVLGLLVAEWLAERFPAEREGQLGPRLAQLVSGPVLARLAAEAGLAARLTLGANEAREGVGSLATVLADAMEAVIGAIYRDAGLDAARAAVRGRWAALIDGQGAPPKDAKTALQEWAMARALPLPDYAVLSCDGPSHDPDFAVRVAVGGLAGEGRAGSKREAQRLAAEALLAALRDGETGMTRKDAR